MHQSDRAQNHLAPKQKSHATQRSAVGSYGLTPDNVDPSRPEDSLDSASSARNHGRSMHERSVHSGLTDPSHPSRPEQEQPAPTFDCATKPVTGELSSGLTHALIENSADCIAVITLDGLIESLNGRAASTLSVNRNEGTHDSLISLWSAADHRGVKEALAVARSGRCASFSAELSAPNGVSAYWNVRVAPLFSPAGEVQRLVAICNDVSEVRMAHAAAIEAERQSTAGRLAASIAHEINNPLDAATNLIYLARTSGTLTESEDQYLAMADSELSRAAQISRQMLSFFRPTARVRWIPLDQLVQSVSAILERKFRAGKVVPFIRVAPGSEIYGNEGELRQVLLNLVGNALEASHSEGGLWIRAAMVPGKFSGESTSVRITIADNGHGMSPEVRQRIFTPFFTTKREHGTGIGLWISKSLVEQHGGSIRVRSREGERSGTVMMIFLPKGRKNMIKRAEVA